MKKNITVIIKNNNSKLGKKGQKLKVAPGYAFNYLIPNDFVEIATKGKIKHFNMFLNIEKQKKQNLQIEALQLKNYIEEIKKINIKKKIGENKQIFGSVNEKEIINIIFHKTGYKLEKKQIEIPEIKTIGLFTISISLFEKETSNLILQIIPENI
uniref:50S ribosomal protein L9, chloroplastic n=1 Tax=Antithamnion hubbsii TaxID=1005974 RepID=A0A4D6WLX1_9FLOR|nr:ribosomal protein L9 [Antithamnion hubbsii]